MNFTLAYTLILLSSQVLAAPKSLGRGCVSSALDSLYLEKPVAVEVLANTSALKQKLQTTWLQKGMSEVRAAHLTEMLVAQDIRQPGNLLALAQSIDPKKLGPKNDSVIAYAMRHLADFHAPGELNSKAAATLLEQWSESELAGLARVYAEASEGISKMAPRQERLNALRQYFEQKGVHPKIADKMLRCGGM